MSDNHIKLMLVTANVGSIFEDPDNMQQIWLKEFLAEVSRQTPDFLAVHCQEVGGKNYEDSMKNVNLFVKSLLASDALQPYDKVRIFLDEDFTAVDKFTALGSLYFVHQSVENVQAYDFQRKEFVPLTGREVLSGNIEHVTIKEKAKFPQEFFPNYKWSRKGFIRTRWNIYNSVFDLVNIHLFHDASNITAMETTPSEYCLTRKNALEYTINRFETDEFPKVPYFIFGDFNFRLDTFSIIQDLTSKLKEHRCTGKKDELSKITYTDASHEKVMLTVEKKGFEHRQHNDIFFNCSKWLKGFDREMDSFSHKLCEIPVTFPPSYPFSEDVSDGHSYMKTRCPSWCDRVLFSPSAKSLFLQDDSASYHMIGRNVCMGDHKPISLNVKLRPSSGNDDVDGCTTSQSPRSQTPDMTSTSMTSDPTTPDPTMTPDTVTARVRRSQRLQKVVSINGEEFPVEEADIHDFAMFQHEQLLSGDFNKSRRRKSSGVEDGHDVLSKKPSFKELVRNVVRAEQVISRLYSHRSDTEEDSDLEEVRRMTPVGSSDALEGGNLRPADGEGVSSENLGEEQDSPSETKTNLTDKTVDTDTADNNNDDPLNNNQENNNDGPDSKPETSPQNNNKTALLPTSQSKTSPTPTNNNTATRADKATTADDAVTLHLEETDPLLLSSPASVVDVVSHDRDPHQSPTSASTSSVHDGLEVQPNAAMKKPLTAAARRRCPCCVIL